MVIKAKKKIKVVHASFVKDTKRKKCYRVEGTSVEGSLYFSKDKKVPKRILIKLSEEED
jgi:hypothetical protein